MPLEGPNIARLRNVRTRSVSAENFAGAKGGGGRATQGTGAAAARDLGVGWKVSPSVIIAPGTTFPMAGIDGSGMITHIWLTTHRDHWRTLVLRAYRDHGSHPAVEVPVGDFFANGWGRFAQVSSSMIAVRVDGDHAGTDLRESAPAIGEEIADGHFNSWIGSVVPISPQHQRPPVIGMSGEPDVSDHAGTVDASHRKRGARCDDHRGRDLPANPNVPGGVCSGALSGPTAAALGAAEVLSADRSRRHVAQPGDIAAIKRHRASFPCARRAVGLRFTPA